MIYPDLQAFLLSPTRRCEVEKNDNQQIPSGYDQHSHGKSPFFKGNTSISFYFYGPLSMAILLLNNQRVDALSDSLRNRSI
jgi:hypothetical protein